MRAELVDLGLEVRLVGGEQVIGQSQSLPAPVVAIEATLEVAGDRCQAPARVRAHADRVELECGHAEIVDQLPEPRQMLDQGGDDWPRRLDVGQRIGDDERLQAGQSLERHRRDLVLAQFLDVDTAMVGDGDGGRPEPRRISYGEVDLVIRRYGGLERHALRLGRNVAMGVLNEIEPLALGQGGLQVAGLADEAGLALLADGTFKDRLDEYHAVAIEHRLDLGLGSVGPEHVGHREVHEAQELGAVEQAAQLHGIASLSVEQNAGFVRHGRIARGARASFARRPMDMPARGGGARLLRNRCSERRCMPSRSAARVMLRSHCS